MLTKTIGRYVQIILELAENLRNLVKVSKIMIIGNDLIQSLQLYMIPLQGNVAYTIINIHGKI